MDDPVTPTYSVSFRLQRTTTEFAFVSVPVTAVILGVLVVLMVPAFQLMQQRIDQINRVLREQITGIRVIRAFVREPEERSRFAQGNAELHCGDCLAWLADFPFALAGRVLIYADPPYPLATRTGRDRYRFDYEDADHKALAPEEGVGKHAQVERPVVS